MNQTQSVDSKLEDINDPLPVPAPSERIRWSRLYGDSLPHALAQLLRQTSAPVVVITEGQQQSERLEQELAFFSPAAAANALHFPDWENLAYDAFSPHQDIISQRIETLYRLPEMKQGLLILPASTLMQRVAPQDYIHGRSLVVSVGERLDIDSMRLRFEQAGYSCVSQVMEHGEYAVRGSILDVYPMGSNLPYRLDLFDDEIESIRTFDPETQRSVEKVEAINLLPAREFPFDKDAIKAFRQHWRKQFEGEPQSCPVYRDVSEAITPSGIEYYQPLFFDGMVTLFDYLPDNALFVWLPGMPEAADSFWQDVNARYEQRRYDTERPILEPGRLYLSPEQLSGTLSHYGQIELNNFELMEPRANDVNFQAVKLPDISLKPRMADPAAQLKTFIDGFDGRLLFSAESTGRREYLRDLLRDVKIVPHQVNDWQDFIASTEQLNLCVSPLEQGVIFESHKLAIITETQLLGQRARQVRGKRKAARDPATIINDLTDLRIGAPVVHEDHGVGRFLGLQKLAVGNQENEFLTLEYAGGDKLYVPVSSLHLIGRYTGTSEEAAPLHKLGSEHWAKAKRKAAERAHDVAAELLAIHAKRAARSGHAFDIHSDEYRQFAAAFPFEETPDQMAAIEAVLEDMAADKPMDRVVCGDVGFGKTEVAMRAAFVAASSGKQVVVLVPTTLLAQQHFNNFQDRMADWPIKIESLSRFKTGKQQTAVLDALANGTIDIVIGTHKVLQESVKYKNLGLVIIDEEHRFGVRQKEKLKSLRAEVDLLTLTATPIPRTLNMAMAGLRDLSIIATPPAERSAIKTFVSEWNDQGIREACLREIKRGGQVYFLHNKVETIEKQARDLAKLVPEATVAIGHGQMRERELEQVMLDFYHRRSNLLVCTTIIESGIDVPTANTIIINRADHLGLAQLHQLRGRVGRSHHRAYAYLVTPHRKAMTPDAIKRLEAIESLEELGSGFSLATHDLEIRGAGELLGDEQSGQIQEIGFTMYAELLERAVKSLREGKEPDLDRPLDHGAEVDLHMPAVIPDDYLPDIHTRLILYKRIASADSLDALKDLQIEMIDRFGLLPSPVKSLFAITELKLKALPLGVKKIDVGAESGRIEFNDTPSVKPEDVIRLIQTEPHRYKLDGGFKLKLTAPMEKFDKRVEVVEAALEALAS